MRSLFGATPEDRELPDLHGRSSKGRYAPTQVRTPLQAGNEAKEIVAPVAWDTEVAIHHHLNSLVSPV